MTTFTSEDRANCEQPCGDCDTGTGCFHTGTVIVNSGASYTISDGKIKELIDEEIGQIWKDCMESPYMQVSNPVGFARAILRKASEK